MKHTIGSSGTTPHSRDSISCSHGRSTRRTRHTYVPTQMQGSRDTKGSQTHRQQRIGTTKEERGGGGGAGESHRQSARTRGCPLAPEPQRVVKVAMFHLLCRQREGGRRSRREGAHPPKSHCEVDTQGRSNRGRHHIRGKIPCDALMRRCSSPFRVHTRPLLFATPSPTAAVVGWRNMWLQQAQS